MTSKEVRLNTLSEKAKGCIACKLHTTRTQVVFGEGNPSADILFIGEGPGRQEDLTGRPFVGKAGELLTRLIEKGMSLKRESVYIANIVKCRPTIDLAGEKDRPPDQEETLACNHFLLEQIKIIQPKVIVTLGNPSTRFLLKTNKGITTLRGTWHEYESIPVMPTYHPSFVLRNGGMNSSVQKEIWSDLVQVLKKLNLPVRVNIKWKD